MMFFSSKTKYIHKLLQYLTATLLFGFILSTSHAWEGARKSNKDISDVIWSPLTEIEITTLENAYLAKSGDADALLDLAIMASGNIRSTIEYQQIRLTILEFVRQLKPQLSQEKNTWRKGHKLYTAMHDEFFLSNTFNNNLRGYNPGQSQFTQIFENKTYNCISSSLLFLVLARYFDLQVEGVTLPSHSFVQLTTPKGEIIEIETTSKAGYGLRHNQAYYEQTNDETHHQQSTAQYWFELLNLEATTYEDYLNREIVSAYQLIADNMNNQHTSTDRMPQADRYRLQEIRGWLLPEHPEAQLFRLYVLNNELISLKKQKQHDKIKKLLGTAQELIAYYEQKFTNHYSDRGRTLDARIPPIITFFYSSHADQAFAEEHYEQAIHYFQEALSWLSDETQKEQIHYNIAVAYLNQGNLFFKKKEYQSAIPFYEQAYSSLNHMESLAMNVTLKNKIDHNMGSAYWNMVIPYLNEGNSYRAYELLEECQAKHPQLKKCHDDLKTLCQSYSVPNCQ